MKPTRKQADSGPDLFDSKPTYRDDVQDFIAEWNSKIWLPKIIVTDRQCKIIRNALRRPFFNTNWRESFKIMARCKWLVFQKRPKLCLDWYLEDDNFDKIIEGKYLDQKDEPTPTHQVTRNGNDEEIL